MSAALRDDEPRLMMAAVQTSRLLIMETHERSVYIDVADAPELRTSRQLLPIAPTRVELSYSTVDGRLWACKVWGDPTAEADRRRRTKWTYTRGERVSYVEAVERRINVTALPDWLADLADRFRPLAGQCTRIPAGGAR